MEKKSPEGEQSWLSEVAQEAAMQQREQEEIENRTLKDFGTEIWNRRGLMEWGTKLLAGQARKELPAAVIFLDLDDMKGLNTRFGHPAVDELLKKFAAHLTSLARHEDVVARYAGDEFVIVLNSASTDNQGQTLERFTKSFETEVDGTPVMLTFTSGVVDVDLKLSRDETSVDFEQRLQDAIVASDKIVMENKNQAKGTVSAR